MSFPDSERTINIFFNADNVSNLLHRRSSDSTVVVYDQEEHMKHGKKRPNLYDLEAFDDLRTAKGKSGRLDPNKHKIVKIKLNKKIADVDAQDETFKAFGNQIPILHRGRGKNKTVIDLKNYKINRKLMSSSEHARIFAIANQALELIAKQAQKKNQEEEEKLRSLLREKKVSKDTDSSSMTETLQETFNKNNRNKSFDKWLKDQNKKEYAKEKTEKRRISNEKKIAKNISKNKDRSLKNKADLQNKNIAKRVEIQKQEHQNK